jgi:hypothetical protein
MVAIDVRAGEIWAYIELKTSSVQNGFFPFNGQ